MTARVLLIGLLLAVAACSPTTPRDGSTPPPVAVTGPAATPRPPVAAPGTAAAALARLPVKGRAPKTGYSRARFQDSPDVAWVDTDHNHCDTRNDVLARDLRPHTLAAGSRCTVETGTLADPYTGNNIEFTQGRRTSEAVQIDHVVALSNAWQTGAQGLDQATRITLANDEPLELFAVDGPTNAAKGDADAATWLPPNKAFRCPYVAHQIAVKTTYHLWVTQPEHDAMAAVLAGCPGQGLPTQGLLPT